MIFPVFLNCLNPVFLELVSGLLMSGDVCEAEIITIVRNVLTCFNIIMLNNYIRVHGDIISDTKIAQKCITFFNVNMSLTNPYG